jgi:formyltetrahydrofolate-dependent phosphoribosylglycinamide formyltransferase
MPPAILCPRLAVLASGGGTTLQNLLARVAAGTLTAEIVGVVASRPDAFALQRARRAGVPTQVIEPTPRADFSERVFAAVRLLSVDYVLLAGWLQLLAVPDDFRLRVLNIHPSLLPAFGGKGMYGHHVHEAALAAGVKVSGCTVHFVDDTYDTGPIVEQRAVNIAACATPVEVAAAVYAAECEAYPAAIRRVAAGRWRLAGRRVVSAD